MNDENARRLAARIARDNPPRLITLEDVKAYRLVHYPNHVDKPDVPAIPGDESITTMPHSQFHDYFGTVCDETCPHPKPLPVARVRRWWFW